MRYDTIINALDMVQEHFNTSVFMSDDVRDNYTALDILLDHIGPEIHHDEWDHIDTLLTHHFGTGEWAGDTWVTYVNQWEQEWMEGVIDMDTLKSYIHLGLEYTIEALIAERDAERGD